MAGSVEDLGAPPDSWEVADLDTSMTRLMLSSRSNSLENGLSLGSSAASVPEDVINSVDQFLLEALRNPRERVSVLRLEQDVEKFIRDPTKQQMEFQQIPTSYLRLAAHRIAQHYSLQSMVLSDNGPDGASSRIIVCKNSKSRLPMIRLADIPVNLPAEKNAAVKVAIKRRPQKHSQTVSDADSNAGKGNSSKTMEERKEEYNRARNRIFNSTTTSSGPKGGIPKSELRVQEHVQHGSHGKSTIEDIPFLVGADVNIGRSVINLEDSSRSANDMTEEPVGRFKTNNRVAIFRDREVERNDPDFDRSYDRYAQRFDPGFGFNGGPYMIQPLYSPVLNYNTEFPQLGSTHQPSISAEHQSRPIPHHLPGTWSATSTATGIPYVPPETMMTPLRLQGGAGPASSVYLHSSHYPFQRPGLQFIPPHEQAQQPFPRSHHQQPDASFGLAQPR